MRPGLVSILPWRSRSTLRRYTKCYSVSLRRALFLKDPFYRALFLKDPFYRALFPLLHMQTQERRILSRTVHVSVWIILRFAKILFACEWVIYHYTLSYEARGIVFVRKKLSHDTNWFKSYAVIYNNFVFKQCIDFVQFRIESILSNVNLWPFLYKLGLNILTIVVNILRFCEKIPVDKKLNSRQHDEIILNLSENKKILHSVILIF